MPIMRICVPIYARLQIFIQLRASMRKLCHIKCDHPVHIICSKCPPSAEMHAFRRLLKSLIALLIVVCGKSSQICCSAFFSSGMIFAFDWSLWNVDGGAATHTKCCPYSATILVPICLYCLNCTKFGQLIIGKLLKIVASRCHILRLKSTKLDFINSDVICSVSKFRS